MKSRLLKLEKFLFYFFVLVFFWQLRIVWPQGGAFNEWTSFYLYATDLILVAVLFLWLIRSGPQFKLKFDRAEIFLVIFLLVSALSISVAPDRQLAVYGLVKLLEFSALFLYVKKNFEQLFSWRGFWQVFIAGALAQSLVAMGQFFYQQSLDLKFFAESPLSPDLAGVAKIVVGGAKIVRAYGLVPHPNILAAILVAAIFGLAWLIIKEYSRLNIWRKIVCALLLAILAMALFFTFSRGVIVIGGLFLIGWLVYLFKEKSYRQSIIFIFVLLFTVNCLLLTVYWPYLIAHFNVENFLASQSVDLRAFYSQSALKMIASHLVLGVGQGNFVATLAATSAAGLEPWLWQPVHNIYLLIVSEIGVLGWLAFLAFLFLTIEGAWRGRKELTISYLLFMVGCLLIIGLFDHFLWDLQQGQIMFWLLLGLLAGFGPRS